MLESKQSDAIVESQKLGLPLPRLQLTWVPGEEPGETFCYYDLICPVGEYDIRNIKATGVAAACFGKTRCKSESGHTPVDRQSVEPPYRDGAHARWDAKLFGFRAFVVNGEKWQELKPND